MQRRHFVKLSATATATLLFSRLTHAAENGMTLINHPEEVWAQAAGEWHQLKLSGGVYSYQDIHVSMKPNGGALAVYVRSPKQQLNAVRLKWKHQVSAKTKALGDHWERSYGDLARKAPDANAKNPWYVLLHDDVYTACFGVKTGCNAICYWSVNPDSIDLTMDTNAGGIGVELGARQLHAADIIVTKNTANENAYATAHRFCKMMCPNPRLPKQPVYGINDWYFAYGNNTAALIKQTTAIMAELVTDTQQAIFGSGCRVAQYSPLLPGDGGWNEDFSKPNDKFKDMHLLADDIKALGMRPGLWTRPLCGRHDEKASRLAPKIPGRDDPKNPVLDPTIPENLERVKYNVATYKKWGYHLVKHDYTTYDIFGKWGFQMRDAITAPGWSFNDKTKTNAEIIKHLYQSIRVAAEDMYVIGCNTISHLSAGIFELDRIGDDTSGKEWARTRKMGVNTMGFRIPQNNAFYAVDGDCVGLTTDIRWGRNKQWMKLLACSGAPLFISAQPEALGAEQKAFIKSCFMQSALVQPNGEPLDWLDNPFPQKVEIERAGGYV